ncbi:MAG: cbb3-type cytochrome c oxidase subunit II [Verrucomicrobiota bacterium]
MNQGPLVFLGAFAAVSLSWVGLVLVPQFQTGREGQGTNIVSTAELYPVARSGQAQQGLEVYRAEGCAACHTEQVGQTATVCDVILTKAGTNQAALFNVLVKAGLGASNPGQFLTGLPKAVRQGISLDQAADLAAELKAAGATSQIQLVPVGPDLARGWGRRRTVARDYLFDSTVMPGSIRIGPDLANIGMRQPDPNWQLRHLYAPASEVKGSPMPGYRFLFEKRRTGRQPSPDALQLPAEWAPPAGYEIVPKPEARALVAYLLSLKSDTPLFEAPMSAPIEAPSTAGTNAPAK